MTSARRPEPTDAPLLRVSGLVKHFPGRRTGLFSRQPAIRAVSGVDFEIAPHETLGLVGESGSGKSTTGRCVIGLETPTAGTVDFDGHSVADANARTLKTIRREMQYVFQDPYASLNPLMTVFAAIAEPMVVAGGRRGEIRDRVAELLRLVGLAPEHANRFPHEFSGGQRQRIGIARALTHDPRLLILDEPVSALDVSIQAQVINLLEDLQERLGLAYLFIAHDLSVVSHICDRVAVMYLGRIVEIGTRDQIFEVPTHPYTQALISAMPIRDPDLRGGNRRIVLSGDLPSPTRDVTGCPFQTRCWKAQSICGEVAPALESQTPDGQRVACHFADVVPAGAPARATVQRETLG
jgi:oligopeptide/dipeptide ABC transporter ATP-binding protein